MTRVRWAVLFALLCAALPLLLFAAEVPAPVQIVVVDPGHGGKDLGAVVKGVEEKSIDLALALKLQEQLEHFRGFWAKLTRATDVYVPLPDRVDRAVESKAKALVSLHVDDVRRGRERGVKVYFYGRFRKIKPRPGERVLPDPPRAQVNASHRLALVIKRSLLEQGIPASALDRGAFVVLKGAQIPSVLIEVGNLRDQDDFKNLSDAAYQEALTRAIAKGVQSYLDEPPALVKR